MKSIKPLLALLLLVSLSACNTMAGVGQDVQQAGSAVEGAAEDCGDANGC